MNKLPVAFRLPWNLRFRWAWPFLIILSTVCLSVSSAAAAVPLTSRGSAPAHVAPQLLRSSPLARPAVKLPPGGGATADSPARQLPRPVSEIVADRTATTSTWRNSDGTLSVRRYLAPHFYRTGSAGWQPVSTRLAAVRGRAGWWQTTANSWQAAFGPAGAADGAEQVTVGGARIGFTPIGVSDASQAPGTSGSTATYRGLWPGVDLTDQVSATGVQEGIALTRPGTAGTFSFRANGATVRANAAGGADVLVGGRTVGVIPPLTVITHSAEPARPAHGHTIAVPNPTKASGTRMTITGDIVRISVSPHWLAGLPASAFPVVIDPTFDPANQLASQLISLGNNGTALGGVLQNGYVPSTHVTWRSEAYIQAPTLPAQEAGAPPWQLVSALFTANCAPVCNISALGVYGEATSPSFITAYSAIPTGTPLQVDSSDVLEESVLTDVTSFFAGQTGGWIGLVANEDGLDFGTLATFDPSQVYVNFSYAENPPPVAITSPGSGSVVATTTPTLTAAAAADPTSSVFYDFVISTSPSGTGTVIDSAWLGTPSWTVPAGSLHDGVTYYAVVYDAITQQAVPTAEGYVPPAAPLPAISFQVKERLGDGGPSPTDTVGSPPGSTSTPSQGSPSPGAPTASETVDMVTGNLAVSVSTHSVQALSGPVGVTLSYNSASSSLSKGGNYGLIGQYYKDSGGSHVFTGSPVGQRTDPNIHAAWPPGSPPIGGLPPYSPFMARWTGLLTLPAGTWQIGGLTTGGMRVYLNGSSTPSYNDWAGTAGVVSPTFGSATVSGGAQYQVEVDDWDAGQGTQAKVQLWAKNTAATDPSKASYLVPSTWLTPAAAGLPPGWSLSANPATVEWTSDENDGGQIILHSPTGETETFTRTSDGFYQAPPGVHDYVTFDGNGRLQVMTPDDYLYTFNADGTLASMTTIADDRHPTALQYSYSGSPALLRTITDPVSGRNVTLSYGGDTGCPTTNPAPAAMLCMVSYWDGTSTTFGYNSNGQITSVTSPGSLTSLFAYDSDNRLADIRDALAVDYVASGGSAGTAATCPTGTTGLSVTPVDTQVCYDSSGRVATVIQPAPTPGAGRAARTYTYSSGQTDVSIAGFSPSSGHAERTIYDSQDRIVQRVDSAGHASTTVWDAMSRPIVSASPAGEQTSTVYDKYGNVTDTYGPAPLACFSGGWPTGVTPTAPVAGYLPVANPQGTSGCGVAVVPHTHDGYDEDVAGLAATYWANGQFAGAAALHGTGTPGASSTFCGNVSGLCAQWAAGSPPVNSDASGTWSLRLTGTITLPDSGGYDFGLYDSEPITVSIDGQLVLADGPAEHAGLNNYFPGQQNWTSTSDGLGFTAGPHAIEVDFQGSATQLNEFSLIYDAWTTGGNTTTPGIVPGSMLDPGYNLKTSSTDPDGITTTTAYSNSTVGPEYGLPTSTIVGVGSSTPLTTTTTYEAPGTGSFLRKTSNTLPGGATTSYSYYTGTGGPVAAACGVTSSTPQGGQLEAETGPAPSPGAAARERQFIYNAAGQQVGFRTGSTADIASLAWQCMTYDSRNRMVSEAYPALNGAPARTVTYTYSVGGNPLVSSVTDASGTITSTVDLLGRNKSYTDAHGQTTTTSYDQAGRTTSSTSPAGTLTTSYDPNTSLGVATALNGTTLATASYDASGRLAGVTYANGTTAAIGYDAYGNQSSLAFTNTSTGTLITADQLTRSAAGRDTSELEDINGTSLTNPNPAGQTATDYAYDGAGRLTSAYLPNGSLATYSYAPNPVSDGCVNANAGADTNRTRVTTTPAAGTAQTTDYCYTNADQLTSTITGGSTSSAYSYDDQGNQANDGGTTLTWGSSGQLASSTTTSGTTTTYTYDAVNRAIARQAGPTTTEYWYSGYGDSPSGTLSAAGTLTSAFISLPAGVSVTVQVSGNTWSYPDLHGNYTTCTNNSGVVQGSRAMYDPWGVLLTGSQPVANAPGTGDLGAFGTSGKVTDTATDLIIMGARVYNPSEARFLSVDPVRGGCANAYVYAFGDPLNHGDLTGQGSCIDASDAEGGPNCSASVHWTGVTASCSWWFGPDKARALHDKLSTLGGSVAVALGIAFGCTATGALAGLFCTGMLVAIAWQLVDDLNSAAEHNQYVTFTFTVSFGLTPNQWHATYSKTPPGGCY
jgi:RHS repeat-associated protein